MADDMMQVLELFDEFETRMDKAVDAMRQEFQSMKAGRANPHLLDKIVVDYYGVPTPINQVGNISVPEARMLVISVWDAAVLKDVERAIINANIGVNPNNDGKVIRLIFPELTEERRKGLVKDVKGLSENTKISLRNARRDANDKLKKLKKDSLITEDDFVTYEKDVDKKLQTVIDAVDRLSKEKETEILSV